LLLIVDGDSQIHTEAMEVYRWSGQAVVSKDQRQRGDVIAHCSNTEATQQVQTKSKNKKAALSLAKRKMFLITSWM